MWTGVAIMVIVFFVAAKVYEYVRMRKSRKKEVQKYYKKKDGTVTPYKEEVDRDG